jgi:hypothetical protein
MFGCGNTVKRFAADNPRRGRVSREIPIPDVKKL